MSARHWADLATTDFAALDVQRAIAVLPLAAIEQHGPHLPLHTDTAIAQGIIAASQPHIPPDLPALFLPVQSAGYSPEHSAFAGTLTLRAQTALHLWMDLAQSVAASGVRKLLLFNTHGGNAALMQAAAREMRTRWQLLVVSANWDQLPLGPAAEMFSSDERRFGVHGGDMETSLILALHPQAVRMDAAQNFASAAREQAAHNRVLGHGAQLAWAAQDRNAQGVMGNAAAAQASKGHALLQAAARALAQLLLEMDALPALPAPPRAAAAAAHTP